MPPDEQQAGAAAPSGSYDESLAPDDLSSLPELNDDAVNVAVKDIKTEFVGGTAQDP